MPFPSLFVASSDKRRVMKAGPPPGINPVYDRYIGGYEGSGVAKSSRGVVELSSNKKIASTGWLMQAVLPVDEAFAPIHAMERHLIVVSSILTLIATVTLIQLRRHAKHRAATEEIKVTTFGGRACVLRIFACQISKLVRRLLHFSQQRLCFGASCIALCG